MNGTSIRVDHAPKSELDAGLIVRFDSDHQAKKYFDEHPVQVRPIHESSFLYEVRGVSESDFKRTVGAHQFIEKNRVMKRLAPKLRARAFFNQSLNRVKLQQSLKSKAAQVFDVSRCVYKSDGNPDLKTPKPVLDVLEPISLRDADTPKVPLGTTIVFDSSRTKNTVPGIRKADVYWKVWGPTGSIHTHTESYGERFSFTPDMPGAFDVTLLARDEEDRCAFVPYTIGVSYAEPFEGVKAARAFAEKDRSLFAHLTSIGAEEAWKTTQAAGQIIAILDSGVNYNHPDLAQNIYVNSRNEYGKNMLDGGGMPFDDYGHGTHVAGLAASAVTGVARNAKILPVKVLDGMGDGDLVSILSGMTYAAEQGAQILNMSLSTQSVFPEERLELSESYLQVLKIIGQKGAVVVAAAGNDGKDIDQYPVYPASVSADSNVLIAVGATQLNGKLSEFSNYGSKSVNVAAPGGSAADMDASKKNENGGLMSTYYWAVGGQYGYVRYSGTSMASPVAAGVVALMKSSHPEMPNFQIKSALMKSSVDVADLRGKVASSGLISAPQAVLPIAPPSKGWTKK